MGLFSNIVHKRDVRVANLENIAPGFKESNRQRLFFNLTAGGSDAIIWVAPYKGSLQDLIVASPAATTSDSSNHVTITVTDLTTSTVLFATDSYTNSFELVENYGVLLSPGTPAVSPATGLPFTEFSQYDVLEIKAEVTGTPGITASSVLPIVATVFVTDHNYAY
jgi:hypothetical protein